ncbi:hypothetical protein EK21DRAFT_82601, partial [Setomelanomma holmii]
ITLKKVAYIPGYVANIFSLSCCKKIYFNSKTNTLFKDLERVGGHWFLNTQDATQPFQAMAAAASTQAKPPQVVTAMKAHQLLGHPSHQAIDHLKDSTTGLTVGTNGKGEQWTDSCIPRIQGKMKEDVSRRQADKAYRPCYRIIVDIIQLQKHGEACYNGDVWALHAVCEYTKLHEICTLKDRHKVTVVPAITRLINKIERVYGYQVAIVFMDGDVG